jgi:VWFA-related protein
MSAMPPADQMRALAAAEKFVRKDMTEADLLAIMRYNAGSMDVLQDFTADRNRILSILETMVVGEGQGNDESTSDDSSSDTGAAFGQDDPEFNIFTTDRQLAALQTATEALSRLNEKKELIYFASGLNPNGIDNQAQLHATIDAAIRAGVSFWPVDTRGLVASGPLGNATQGSQGGASMYTGGAATALTTRFEASQDTLYALAGDTGGKALLDNNDLAQGIVNAQHAESNYYILGYYSTNTAKNGKFRKIKVALNNTELAANMDYRQGYYADKEWGKFNTADKERQLEDALMQGDPWTDLTIALELNYFQLNRAEYFVPVEVKIPGRELALAKKHGAESTTIDFVDEVKDDYGGTTESNKTDTIPIKLSDATAAEWAKRPIDYHTGYTLLPGKYTIKVLARDDVTGTLGTFQTSFVIPNLNKETKRVPISSVVLSSQRAPAGAALFNTAKGKEQAKETAADPMVQNGLRLVPSVTRVFSRTRSLYVYLQAYEGTETPAPLIAFVTLYQGQTKVLETQPQEVSPLPNTRLETAPLSFTVDLATLQPGKYDCQVTVLDPTGQKSNYWQAPIMVVQ